jgi:hypothetical protein
MTRCFANNAEPTESMAEYNPRFGSSNGIDEFGCRRVFEET